MRAAAAWFAAMLAPSLAAADSTVDPLYHVSGGVEVETDGNVTSTAFRARALLGHAFGDGPARPEIAAGGTLGLGGLFVPDPRAVTGQLSLSSYTFGPEAQIALQLYDGNTPTTRMFASAAYLREILDPRLAMDPVPGVGGNHGSRFGLGVNFARTEAHHCGRTSCDMLFEMLVPQQIELSVEQDAGSTRVGGTLSWGI